MKRISRSVVKEDTFRSKVPFPSSVVDKQGCNFGRVVKADKPELSSFQSAISWCYMFLTKSQILLTLQHDSVNLIKICRFYKEVFQKMMRVTL